MTTAAPKNLPVAVETTFLGVRTLPSDGAGTPKVEAIVKKAGNGGIAALSPEEQRLDEGYRRLNASAAAALEALRVKEERKRPEEEAEQNPRRRDDVPPPPTRGGGGGGG